MGDYKRIEFNIPEYVEEETKVFINAVVDELNEREGLSVTMLGALNVLMSTYNTFALASKEVRQEGEVTTLSIKGDKLVSPAVNVQAKYAQAIYGYLKDFGLTPKSNATLKVMNKAEEAGQLSIFESTNFDD